MEILSKDQIGMFLISLEKRLTLWTKKNIGLPELLIALRHVIISIQSWYLSPLLLKNFNNYGATFGTFILASLVSILFIKVSDRYKNDWFKMEALKSGEHIKSKTILVKFLIILARKKKRVSKFLFFLDPQLFALWYRDGHHLYNGFPSKKAFFFFEGSSLFAAILWTVLVMISNYLGILPYFTVILIGSLAIILFLIIGSIVAVVLLRGLIFFVNNLKILIYATVLTILMTIILSMKL